jgi:hypothetical protein
MERDKDDSFERSHQLSRQQIEDAISPHDVASALLQADVKYVLIGGHVLAYFTGTPRATVDVDVIVPIAQMGKAVKALHTRFPELEPRDLTYNVRFSSRNAQGALDPERIDVVRAGDPFFQRVLNKYSVAVHSRGKVIQVPAVEAAVALKFAAAISPNRGDESRPQDRVDLVAIIRKQPTLRPEVLVELGDLIYPGGGKELQDFVDAVKQGRPTML